MKPFFNPPLKKGGRGDFRNPHLAATRINPPQPPFFKGGGGWLAGLFFLSLAAHAAPDLAAPADLPPAAAVSTVLEAHPDVLAARARVAAALAEGRVLKAGEYEYQAGVGYSRRRETGVGNMNDWELSIERGLRLPGKARLDAEIGASLATEAEERVGDARHEAARDLLATWYAALRAQGETQIWGEQAGLLKRQLEVVEKRVKAGDAARMERSRAEADLRQAEAEARRAEMAAAEAAAGLAARFPGLPPPAMPTATDALPALGGDAAEWVEAGLEHNHELAILRQESERMRIQARRRQAELTPDPSIGLRYARERDGQDNLLGVSLTLPLPGANRRARIDVATQEALALTQREAGAKARIEGGIRVTHSRLRGSLNRSEAIERMARQLDGYADLAWRAYQMGETPLSEALNARKGALDARREATLARLDANEAAARLLLDSHRLWPLDEQAEHHATR